MIRVFDDDAFERLCRVEGESYRENQESFGDYSFAAFHDRWWKIQPWWRRIARHVPSLRGLVKDPPSWMPGVHVPPRPWMVHVGHSVSIYGFHGWNRYLVRQDDGAMFLHEDLAPDPSFIALARDVGFGIFPSDVRSE